MKKKPLKKIKKVEKKVEKKIGEEVESSKHWQNLKDKYRFQGAVILVIGQVIVYIILRLLVQK